MSSHLISWNPKNFSTGGDGSERGSLDYPKGDVVQWSCHSKQVLEGDTVYLIKLGRGAKGIIAKGTVTKASYLDQCWKDPTKERTYIDFRVEDIRHNCNEGQIPQVLLQKACPEQQWSPQSSGILIRAEYVDVVNRIWQEGSSVHSLTLYFNWMSQHEKYPQAWYKSYTEMCELGKSIKQSQKISDDELEKIWAKRENGIASVGQGFMYKKEFEQNRDYLHSITLDIINKPTKETYDLAHKEWRIEGDFERTLWSVIRRVFALADPEHLTSIVGDGYLDIIFPLLSDQFELNTSRSKSWFDDNASLLEVTYQYIPADTNSIRRNILLWLLYEYSQPSKNKVAENGIDSAPNKVAEPVDGNYEGIVMNSSLNQILYGPPGTGKTYRTVQIAVDAAEPSFVPSGVNIDQVRRAYKTRYDALVSEGRIRFVTFHQSYGYEEFVEGLSAKTEGDQLSYFEKDGVFKSICMDARQGIVSDEQPIEIALNKFKLELEEIAKLELTTKTGKSFSVEYHGNTTFRVFPKDTIQNDLGNGYPVSIENIKKLYRDNDDKGIYNQSYVKAILTFIQGKFQVPNFEAIKPQTPPNFVLIIDEINRGNISKIFGELITLIEPSKRLGEAESLQVVLPYSGDLFSVPDNLYIIGTMNTADRSLALMDTALRRRFDFVEMMPDYSVFFDDNDMPYSIIQNEISINLGQLLQTLNKRITALYDREHTLGHAFLMPVVEKVKADNHQSALAELAKCFKNKIIPLLAEYFFEDWQKIRLVLGDNQKENLKLAPLIEKLDVEFESLFGDTDDLELIDDEVHDYRLISADSKLWNEPVIYLGMYDVNQLVE
tara:strand:+ start:3779 stop:6271 length:2493 start_codon:yes stop_codon:yes gene_type:complete